MRILAIDHGTQRMGIAVSDEMKLIAQPLAFIPAQPWSRFLDGLRAIVEDQGVEKIVVGMPRNMDGSYGPAAERVREFIRALQEALKVPLATWDERLTTSQADRLLIQAGMRRQRRKTKVDQTAAAILLQSYLDHLQSQTGEA